MKNQNGCLGSLIKSTAHPMEKEVTNLNKLNCTDIITGIQISIKSKKILQIYRAVNINIIIVEGNTLVFSFDKSSR